MSVLIGSATDYADLLNQLDTFLTSTLSPPWTSLRRNAGVEMIWQAPGAGGLDEIIVGAQVFSDVTGNYYNWRLGGFQAFSAGAPFNQQAGYVGGASQAHPSPVLPLWDSTIPFWFIANGRRAIVIAKISATYMSCYLGFMAPYMAPGSFPYPLIVGGSLAFAGAEPIVGSPNWRWSYAGTEMRSFPIPVPLNLGADADSSLRLRLPSGAWRGFSTSAGDANYGKVWPYAWVNIAAWDWRPNLDGGYPLLPIVLCDNTPNVYGELDGVYALTGFSQGAENTITIGGVTYLVVQNTFRNTKSDFFAVRLS